MILIRFQSALDSKLGKEYPQFASFYVAARTQVAMNCSFFHTLPFSKPDDKSSTVKSKSFTNYMKIQWSRFFPNKVALLKWNSLLNKN